MKLDDIKEEHIAEIVRIYESVCGWNREFKDAMYSTPEQVIEDIKQSMFPWTEYRIGSKWDGHSKIYFETDIEGNLSVRFNSNFDPSDRKGRRCAAAEKAGNLFVKTAMIYLQNQSPANGK